MFYLIIISVYFLFLLVVTFFASRKATNESFFIGNRNSNWMLVAFGMIGTTLSGVTFVSVPGAVGQQAFTYLQITLGYFLGYLVVIYLLLPLYYRTKITSIYTYLNQRFGITSYKTGASFFLLARTLGATARLYLVVNIVHATIIAQFGLSFWQTALLIMLLILLYTFKGGVKSIIWTDTVQTCCMLVGLFACIYFIFHQMGFTLPAAFTALRQAGYTHVLVTDANSKLFFVKQLLAGAFITIAMTGLDQEMMQKNISIRGLRDAQKNMLTLASIMVVVTFSFLLLGGLLHLYAHSIGVDASGDALFPTLALQHMSPAISIVFIIALISTLFPSADGAITALTSSFCIDIIGINRQTERTELWRVRVRRWVHLSLAVVFLVMMLVFRQIESKSMINLFLSISGYTYGPLLGLFAFGIATSRKLHERWVPLVCVLGPVACFLIDTFQSQLFGDFKIGLELILINGALVFGGLMAISYKHQGEY